MHVASLSRTLLLTVLALSCSFSAVIKASRFREGVEGSSDQDQPKGLAQKVLANPEFQSFIAEQHVAFEKQPNAPLSPEKVLKDLQELWNNPAFKRLIVELRASNKKQEGAQLSLEEVGPSDLSFEVAPSERAENNLFESLPVEMRREITGRMSLEAYVAMLQTFKGARKIFRLSFEKKVAWLGREFDNVLAIKLMSL